MTKQTESGIVNLPEAGFGDEADLDQGRQASQDPGGDGLLDVCEEVESVRNGLQMNSTPVKAWPMSGRMYCSTLLPPTHAARPTQASKKAARSAQSGSLR